MLLHLKFKGLLTCIKRINCLRGCCLRHSRAWCIVTTAFLIFHHVCCLLHWRRVFISPSIALKAVWCILHAFYAFVWRRFLRWRPSSLAKESERRHWELKPRMSQTSAVTVDETKTSKIICYNLLSLAFASSCTATQIDTGEAIGILGNTSRCCYCSN